MLRSRSLRARRLGLRMLRRDLGSGRFRVSQVRDGLGLGWCYDLCVYLGCFDTMVRDAS